MRQNDKQIIGMPIAKMEFPTQRGPQWKPFWHSLGAIQTVAAKRRHLETSIYFWGGYPQSSFSNDLERSAIEI
jgi:hypothetical protein